MAPQTNDVCATSPVSIEARCTPPCFFQPSLAISACYTCKRNSNQQKNSSPNFCSTEAQPVWKGCYKVLMAHRVYGKYSLGFYMLPFPRIQNKSGLCLESLLFQPCLVVLSSIRMSSFLILHIYETLADRSSRHVWIPECVSLSSQKHITFVLLLNYLYWLFNSGTLFMVEDYTMEAAQTWKDCNPIPGISSKVKNSLMTLAGGDRGSLESFQFEDCSRHIWSRWCYCPACFLEYHQQDVDVKLFFQQC